MIVAGVASLIIGAFELWASGWSTVSRGGLVLGAWLISGGFIGRALDPPKRKILRKTKEDLPWIEQYLKHEEI